jgi:HPt (histidine-containing phosphotransfer) domain-containing protein
MSSNQDPAHSKKKETRAGTRRVTSLTAEQLERKRANDREAQRTIRQRTKEHIERLELQVAELRAKGDKFDEVVRRNALLETEIRALRHQLSTAAGSTGYQNLGKLLVVFSPVSPY